MDFRGRWKRGWKKVCVVLCLATTDPASAQIQTGQVVPGDVSVLQQVAQEAGLSDLQVSTRVISPGRIIAEGFSARLGSGIIQGRGLVELSNPGRQHRMRVSVSGVDAQDLVRLLRINLNGTVTGRIDGDMDLIWSGLTGSQVKRTLTGPVRLRAGAGSLSNADVLNQAVQATGVQELKTFTFTSARGGGVFRSGRFDIENMVIGGPTEEVRGRGTILLPTGDVAMRLEIYLESATAARSSRADVRATGQAAAGVRGDVPSVPGRRTYPAAQQLVRIPVPVAVAGPMRDPQFAFGGR